METTTNEIIRKIKESARKTLEPLVKSLMYEGAQMYDLERAIQNYTTLKIKEFYRKAKEPQLFKDILDISFKQESKAEASVATILQEAGIKYKYQYPIGKYRVDFLLGDSLVLEIDGPHHKKQLEYDMRRDKYIKKMGYEVLRIPIRLFALDPEYVVEHFYTQFDVETAMQLIDLAHHYKLERYQLHL